MSERIGERERKRDCQNSDATDKQHPDLTSPLKDFEISFSSFHLQLTLRLSPFSGFAR